MRNSLTVLRLAFTTAATAWGLVGCATGGSTVMPSDAAPVPSRGQMAPQKTAVDQLGLAKSWMSPTSKSTPLLYVSDGEEGYVLIYPATGHNPAPVGQLSGFDIAAGLAVDNAGNLYVADVVNERVQVFHRGSTSPFEILNATGTSMAKPLTIREQFT